MSVCLPMIAGRPGDAGNIHMPSMLGRIGPSGWAWRQRATGSGR